VQDAGALFTGREIAGRDPSHRFRNDLGNQGRGGENQN